MKLQKITKAIREQAKFAELSVYLITDKNGQEIARLHCTYDGIKCRVDVYENGAGKIAQYKGRNMKSALDRAVIADVTLYEDSVSDAATLDILADYHLLVHSRAGLVAKASDNGMYFTNMGGAGLFQNCYYVAGLERLHHFGYIVHRVL